MLLRAAARFVRRSGSTSSAAPLATPVPSSAAWVRENAALLGTVGGFCSAALLLAFSVSAMKTQVSANAEMMKASHEASAAMLDKSQALLERKTDAALAASAAMLDKTLELLESKMEAAHAQNAELLNASIAQLGEKTRLIAENESHKSMREYGVRALGRLGGVS